jgi:hypothetical protein
MMRNYSSQTEAAEIGHFLSERIYERGIEHPDRVDWTDAVQLSLHDYIENKGWTDVEVLPPVNLRAREQSRRDPFLLDFVVWRRNFPEKKEGSWIACESEWDLSVDSVVKDFQKLPSFRAPYKLMIYDVEADRKSGDECRRRFEKVLSTFQWNIVDEIYIFLEFIKGGTANCYTCNPAEDTRLSKVREARKIIA